MTLGRGAVFSLGLLAVGVAACGEALIRSGNSSGLGGLFYLLAIALFAVGAWPLPSAVGDSSPPRGLSRSLGLLAAAVVLAVAAEVVMLRRLVHGNESLPTVVLWLLGPGLLLLAGILARDATAHAPVWGATRWPATRRGRWILLLVLFALLAVAALCRLSGLSEVPYGINADEGDRAAVAIQIVRGQSPSSVFGIGWYHISMVYFKLLALVMKFAGLNFAGARVLGAISGILTVVVLTWLAIRNFGWRAGLLTGVISSTLGVALQFSRETTEAGPTATLWTVSGALLLEAARAGATWAWIGAGIAGGASVYFYPTGRLWPVLAALSCLSLLARGPHRGRVLAGTVLAAVAAVAIMAPFFLQVWQVPNDFTVRAHETSIFVKENPLRLDYYKPTWSLGQLLKAQVDHSLGVFNKYLDRNFFWPTYRPLLPPALAVLTLVGLGAATLRIMDPRLTLLAIWFWVGFVGVIVTVETPNLQRMATAVPLLGLLAALVLDDLARRAESISMASERLRVRAATAVVTLAAAVMAWREGRFYFRDYAAMDMWPYTRVEGQTVAREGKDGLVVSLSYQFHMVNSGWVRLLAPTANRAGVLTPGSFLPLSMPADKDLAFFVYPGQSYYLPYLADILPGGRVTRITHPPDVFMFSLYRVPREAWARQQGALARAPGTTAVAVPAIGQPPPGWTRFPGAMTWSAALRVPQYWNYGFRAGPGPARLVLDGKEILKVPEGEASATASVSLARGDHGIVFEGVVTRPGEPALFEWESLTPEDSAGPSNEGWQKIPTASLRPSDGSPTGLFGIIDVPGRPQVRRLDPTVATGGLGEEARSGGPFEAKWAGTLRVPKTGSYEMGLRAVGGPAALKLDGKTVVQSEGERDEVIRQDVPLDAGAHSVELDYDVRHGPGGIEWLWKPPGGAESIVPPSVLSPPPGAGLGPRLPLQVLGAPESQPVDQPTYTTP